MFISGVSMEAISFKGRWVCISSLRSYLQEGTARLVWARLAQDAQASCLADLKRYRAVLEGPPATYACWPQQWKRK